MLWAVLIVALGIAEPAPQREQAAEAFRVATAQFNDQDYEAALAKFREAYRLAPHDKVRFNIGQCLIRLGRWVEAYIELDAAADSTQLSAGERETARTAANEAASHLGTLRFTGGPAREVVVDDTLRCIVPCTMLVEPGSHAVSLVGEPTVQHEVRIGEITDVDLSKPEPPPPVVPPPTAPLKEDRPPPPKRVRPSALTWVGLGLAVGGGAGIIGFGVRANALHEDYVADPDPPTRQRGVTMRNLANASIAVALLGAVLITADLIRMRVKRRASR